MKHRKTTPEPSTITMSGKGIRKSRKESSIARRLRYGDRISTFQPMPDTFTSSFPLLLVNRGIVMPKTPTCQNSQESTNEPLQDSFPPSKNTTGSASKGKARNVVFFQKSKKNHRLNPDTSVLVTLTPVSA